jgi:protein-S-isoprenylcysteine O-methyltransferase Ste14
VRRRVGGAVAALCFEVSTTFALDLLAWRLGWWRSGATSFVATPLARLGATLVFTALAFALSRAPLLLAVAACAALDALVSGATAGTLGPGWQAGRALAVLAGHVPALLLVRWTEAGTRALGRAALLFVAFPVLPVLVVLAESPSPRALAPWTLAGCALLLLLVWGAIFELATRGGGTQFPLDPTRRLVTSGLFAYVTNPMQVGATLLAFTLALVLEDARLAAVGLAGLVTGIGCAGWDEDRALVARFGPVARAYRSSVPAWLPRRLPFHASRSAVPAFAGARAARLSLAPGSAAGRFFSRRRLEGLEVVPGTSVRYEDGEHADEGLLALVRALDHLGLGWALLAALLRAPLSLRREGSASAGPCSPRPACSPGTGTGSVCHRP